MIMQGKIKLLLNPRKNCKTITWSKGGYFPHHITCHISKLLDQQACPRIVQIQHKRNNLTSAFLYQDFVTSSALITFADTSSISIVPEAKPIASNSLKLTAFGGIFTFCFKSAHGW